MEFLLFGVDGTVDMDVVEVLAGQAGIVILPVCRNAGIMCFLESFQSPVASTSPGSIT